MAPYTVHVPPAVAVARLTTGVVDDEMNPRIAPHIPEQLVIQMAKITSLQRLKVESTTKESKILSDGVPRIKLDHVQAGLNEVCPWILRGFISGRRSGQGDVDGLLHTVIPLATTVVLDKFNSWITPDVSE